MGDDCDHRSIDPGRPELVGQRAADDVADATLRVRHCDVESDARDVGVDAGDDVGAAKDEAGLGPVAVRHHDCPSVGHHGGDLVRDPGRGYELIGDAAVLVVRHQGVATDRDHGGAVAHSPASTAASASTKHAIGARAMPAPI